MQKLNNIQEWNPSETFKKNEPFAGIISASRNSGKTYLIRYLYKHHLRKNFDIVIVFCGSKAIDTYAEWVPGQLLFSEFDPEIIKRCQDQYNEFFKIYRRPMRTLVIMDDILTDKLMYDQTIKDLYTKGRHCHISLVILGHKITMFNTAWRENITFLICLRTKTNSAKEHLIDQYLADIYEEDANKSKADIKREWLDCIRTIHSVDYQAIVVDYEKTDNQIMKYKAK